jgi:hypothetical protein
MHRVRLIVEGRAARRQLGVACLDADDGPAIVERDQALVDAEPDPVRLAGRADERARPAESLGENALRPDAVYSLDDL